MLYSAAVLKMGPESTQDKNTGQALKDELEVDRGEAQAKTQAFQALNKAQNCVDKA